MFRYDRARFYDWTTSTFGFRYFGEYGPVFPLFLSEHNALEKVNQWNMDHDNLKYWLDYGDAR